MRYWEQRRVDIYDVIFYNGCYRKGQIIMIAEAETKRQTYPARVVRAAMYLFGAGEEAGLRDEDIEDMLGIETAGIVAIWRQRGRGGSWMAKRAWVESEVEEEEVRPFELHDEMALLRSSIEVAGLLLEKCKEAMSGKKDVEIVAGVKLTTRNVTEALQRSHIIINKDAARLRELEESTRDERQIEEERIRQILRQIIRVVEWTPEQLEALRKEFPGMLPVVSEIMPMVEV